MSIVNFPPRPPAADNAAIWVCKCGCSSFELHSDGSVECCNCSLAGENAEWMRRKPEVPANPPEIAFSERRITRFNTGAGALQRVLRNVNDRDTSFVIAAGRNGTVATWNSEEFLTSDAVWWLDEQLSVGRSLLLPEGAEMRSLDEIRARITNSTELHSVVIVRQDGEVTVWLSANCNIETPEQEAWLDRKLEAARRLLINEPPKETP